jgi:hypothetical protein
VFGNWDEKAATVIGGATHTKKVAAKAAFFNPNTIRCSLTQRIATRPPIGGAGTHQRTRDEPSRVECCPRQYSINNISTGFSPLTREVFPGRNAGIQLHSQLSPHRPSHRRLQGESLTVGGGCTRRPHVRFRELRVGLDKKESKSYPFVADTQYAPARAKARGGFNTHHVC